MGFQLYNLDVKVSSILQQFKRMAENRLMHIHQEGAMRTYVNEFVRISHVLQWSDAPLMVAFYAGLRDDVKDILCMRDLPDTLSRFIEQAAKLDDRIQELGRKQTGSRPWGR
jgi:hypothetical protein